MPIDASTSVIGSQKISSSRSTTPGYHDDFMYPSTMPFVFVHVVCLLAIWSGVTWKAGILCVALYVLRMFAIGAGYHRYFSHRAYATSRAFQFVLALLAQSAAQKSVLWWAAKHRHHHLHADTAYDVHSPRHSGFLYSHVGWIFSRSHDKADLSKVADLTRFPELRWLHTYEQLPAVALAILCFMIDGVPGLVVGFGWSTVLVYHATFCINSLAHVKGRRRYVTGDDSRNNWVLALVTMGEGWHNNHHAYQTSARQGFRWWEIDPTYYGLYVLSLVGIVWDLKTPPERLLRNKQRLGTNVINKVAADFAARLDPEQIALALQSCLQKEELLQLRERIGESRHRRNSALTTMHLPHVPSRDQLLRDVRAVIAPTPSIEEIVDRTRERLLAAIGEHLNKRQQPDLWAQCGKAGVVTGDGLNSHVSDPPQRVSDELRLPFSGHRLIES